MHIDRISPWARPSHHLVGGASGRMAPSISAKLYSSLLFHPLYHTNRVLLSVQTQSALTKKLFY